MLEVMIIGAAVSNAVPNIYIYVVLFFTVWRFLYV